MMALAAFFFFRENYGKIEWVPIFLAVIAVVLVNSLLGKGDVPGGSNRFLGNILMVGTVVGEAFSLLM